MLFDSWRQRVLPWGHIGVTWRIRLNLCILRPTRVHNRNAKSIGSAVFAQTTGECPILYNALPVSHSKLPLPMLASRRHVIRGSLGPPESGTQMATWSLQSFFSGLTSVTDWQNDRQTDKPRYSVRCGVIMRNYVAYSKAAHSFHVSTNNFATI